MLEPLYMLCCHFGSEDKKTGLLSHFGVIDQLRIKKIDQDSPPLDGKIIIRSLPFRVVAVWMKSEDEPSDDYETETRVIFPPEDNEWVAHSSPIAFRGNRLKLVIDITSLLFQGSGVLRVQNCIRHASWDDWKIQTYPIDLVVTDDLDKD